uniref:Acyl-CoA_dh_M domain-containing protein n=1 Tax=Strongyloides papillosus TaxID=174720 RepID=A0A0N5BN17_STREA
MRLKQGQASSPLADGFASRQIMLCNDRTRYGKGKYILNGRKCFTTGPLHLQCKIYIFMGRITGWENNNKHLQRSMILVPIDTPGVRIVRLLVVFGGVDTPLDHAEVNFENVVVGK